MKKKSRYNRIYALCAAALAIAATGCSFHIPGSGLISDSDDSVFSVFKGTDGSGDADTQQKEASGNTAIREGENSASDGEDTGSTDMSGGEDAGLTKTSDGSLWEPIPEGDAHGKSGNAASGSDTEDPSAGDSSSGGSTAEKTGAGTDRDTKEDTEETSAANEGDTSSVDTAEPTAASAQLTEMLTGFISSHSLNTGNFACAYKNLATGETCYYNELKMFDGASTYKLPLNLLYYDMQAAGKISGDDIVAGTNSTLSNCHYQSLVYSNNELSEAMTDDYGSYDVLKKDMCRYYTLSSSEIDESYYHHNYFCARMMMDCAEYVYTHQSQYSEALGYMKQAQPGEYFRSTITDCEIAQKYGRRDGWENCAGIVFAEKPFVLSVYTYNAGGAAVIGELAKDFYDYTET